MTGSGEEVATLKTSSGALTSFIFEASFSFGACLPKLSIFVEANFYQPASPSNQSRFAFVAANSVAAVWQFAF